MSNIVKSLMIGNYIYILYFIELITSIISSFHHYSTIRVFFSLCSYACLDFVKGWHKQGMCTCCHCLQSPLICVLPWLSSKIFKDIPWLALKTWIMGFEWLG